ncbi:GlcNAc-PI de-N-acetylase [Candidatus Magnetomorum sp. HK-1]|nr:GlcNAc-PI de-N-acetylase [Candidatus Magnetomorum sp. HK-1]
MNALVIAAHPDDELLGCGGTIARHAVEGHNIYVLILGEGVTSRSHKTGIKEQLELLHRQALEVSQMLGVKECMLKSFPDNRFDTLPLLDIVQMIESVICQIKPDVVYTHSGCDLNIDHQITFKATLTAVRPMPGSPVSALYSYEVPSSTEWSFNKFKTNFCANRFVDISEYLDTKIEAMNKYSGELRIFPHPRSEKAIRASARRWGSVVGVRAAEPFQTIFEKV